EFGETVQIDKIDGGVSNPTMMISTISDGALRRYVLRKKPGGQLLQSAHQVDREARAMMALHDTDVPVPTVRLYCDDTSVVGTEFYVMDFMEGRVFRDARLPDLTPADREAVYDELNLTLARLHAVDPDAVGLGDYGRPGNYFERQIGRWTKQYELAKTSVIP